MKGATARSYFAHASPLTDVTFLADDQRVISSGGNDLCLYQWSHRNEEQDRPPSGLITIENGSGKMQKTLIQSNRSALSMMPSVGSYEGGRGGGGGPIDPHVLSRGSLIMTTSPVEVDGFLEAQGGSMGGRRGER